MVMRLHLCAQLLARQLETSRVFFAGATTTSSNLLAPFTQQAPPNQQLAFEEYKQVWLGILMQCNVLRNSLCLTHIFATNGIVCTVTDQGTRTQLAACTNRQDVHQYIVRYSHS